MYALWVFLCVAHTPEQNPTATVHTLHMASLIKRGHMVTEESGEAGTRRPMYAVFVHIKGHVTTCLGVCKARLMQKIMLS